MVADYIMGGPSAVLPQSSTPYSGPWLESHLSIQHNVVAKDPKVSHSLYEVPGMSSDAVGDELLGPVIRKAVWQYRNDFTAAKEQAVRSPTISVELFEVPPERLGDLRRLCNAFERAMTSFDFTYEGHDTRAPMAESERAFESGTMLTISKRLRFAEVKFEYEAGGRSAAFDRAASDLRDHLESCCRPENATGERFFESWRLTPDVYARLLNSLLPTD